jgi:hypothetical protein
MADPVHCSVFTDLLQGVLKQMLLKGNDSAPVSPFTH